MIQTIVITDTEHHQDQLQRLERAFESRFLEEISVTELAEVQLFAQLTATGLGIDECSAIAVAAHRKLTLAIESIFTWNGSVD